MWLRTCPTQATSGVDLQHLDNRQLGKDVWLLDNERTASQNLRKKSSDKDSFVTTVICNCDCNPKDSHLNVLDDVLYTVVVSTGLPNNPEFPTDA